MGKTIARAKNDPELLSWTASELQNEVEARVDEGQLSQAEAMLCNELLFRANACEGDTSLYLAPNNDYDDSREYDAYLNAIAYILARNGRGKVEHPNPSI